jgi:predicted enzyme involved in methoxymalonyl-ACP biosynthesis
MSVKPYNNENINIRATALKEFWGDEYNKSLFLWEGSKHDYTFTEFDGINAPTFPDIFYTVDQKEAAIKDCKNIYHKHISLISEKMNSIHKINHPETFWSIVFGYWLYRHICIVYEKYAYLSKLNINETSIKLLDKKSYLRSLEMKADFRPANEVDLPRLGQMEIKTNQFNLSTRRLSQEQLLEMLESPEIIMLVATLEDRFTNHGLVSYLAAKQNGSKLIVTDWLMSCRVFSRTLELFMLENLLGNAQLCNIEEIFLEFNLTAKNGVMKAVFNDLGFQETGTLQQGNWKKQVETDNWGENFIIPYDGEE